MRQLWLASEPAPPYDGLMQDSPINLDRRPTEPVGLYVHVPFCETKCGYCDFYSVAHKDRDTAPLVDRLIREMRVRVHGLADRVRTAFFGGGTPTILPIDQLAQLLSATKHTLRSAALEEWTVEANPATVNRTKAALLMREGVNRVSMGAQSFFPAELAVLERLHSPDDIAPSVDILRQAGVSQINIDLIFGIPGQTIATWSESLRRAIELEPNHIACYGLTYEPNTRLTALKVAGKMKPCDENLEADQFFLTIDTLEAAGYRQYETSNFARPGCECRHNLIYWRNQSYIGVGPSAAGCVDGRRYKNVPDIAAYIRMMDAQGHTEIESEIIDREKLILEMVLMQLRLVEGLSIPDFQERIGLSPKEVFNGTLDRLASDGLLTVTRDRIAFTREGRLVADRILRSLAEAMPTLGRAERELPVLA